MEGKRAKMIFDIQKAEEALREHWGHEMFHADQSTIIQAIMAGRDVLGVLPTGYGKSVTFQIPALLFGNEGITLVISPLIALMKDQVDDCNRRNIMATYINSHIDEITSEERLAAMVRGEYRLVYVAPERLKNLAFISAIRETPVKLLAVDECHCVSRYGHDFRPAYTQIRDVIDDGHLSAKRGCRPTVVGMTATATPDIEDEIAAGISLSEDYLRVVADPIRPNLQYDSMQGSPWVNVCRVLDNCLKGGRHIVYCPTRNGSERVSETINDHYKFKASAYYHAGMNGAERNAVQERFKSGEVKIICATCAFGMGIDVPDIRLVVHFGIPQALEDYVQESGRAGRDGKLSQIVVLHDGPDDFAAKHAQRIVDSNNPPYQLYQVLWVLLHNLLNDDRDILRKSSQSIAGMLMKMRSKLEIDYPDVITMMGDNDRGAYMFGSGVESALNTMQAYGGLHRIPMDGGSALTFNLERIFEVDEPNRLPEKQMQVVRVLIDGYVNPHVAQLSKKKQPIRGEFMVLVKQVDIARQARVSPRTVLMAMRWLEGLEVMTREREFPGKASKVLRWGAEINEVVPVEDIERKRARAVRRLDHMRAYAVLRTESERKQYIREYFGSKSDA